MKRCVCVCVGGYLEEVASETVHSGQEVALPSVGGQPPIYWGPESDRREMDSHVSVCPAETSDSCPQTSLLLVLSDSDQGFPMGPWKLGTSDGA